MAPPELSNPLNYVQTIREQLYQGRDAIQRVRHAKPDYYARVGRFRAAEEKHDVVGQELHLAEYLGRRQLPKAHGIYDEAGRKLDRIDERLARVRNPDGYGEKFRAGFRRGNRRLDADIKEVGELDDNVQKTAQAQLNLFRHTPDLDADSRREDYFRPSSRSQSEYHRSQTDLSERSSNYRRSNSRPRLDYRRTQSDMGDFDAYSEKSSSRRRSNSRPRLLECRRVQSDFGDYDARSVRSSNHRRFEPRSRLDYRRGQNEIGDWDAQSEGYSTTTQQNFHSWAKPADGGNRSSTFVYEIVMR